MTAKDILKYAYRRGWKYPKEKIRSYYYKERHVSYGIDYPNVTFYVIRRQDDYHGCGLFSHLITTVGRIKYAVDRGYVPIVDMMNYPNLYISPQQLHKVNAWEYYFEQPFGYNIMDIKNAQNVILGSGDIIEDRPDGIMSKEEFETWKSYMKYINLNSSTSDYIDGEWERLFPHGERVLGVLCRGTDYVALKPKNHPIQPSVDEVIEKIYKTIQMQHYDKIFLATEDIDIFNCLKHEFEDKIITNKKEFVSYSDKSKGIGKFSVDRENDEYLKGLEYLTSIAILSRCNTLIAGQCGGTTGALLLSEGYESVFLFDLGKY